MRIYKLLRLPLLFILLIFNCYLSAYSQTENEGVIFKFKFIEGDSYKVHSIVDEDVYVNDVFHHKAHIVNRIDVKVSDVKPKTDNKPASALFSCMFMTSEQNDYKTFKWHRNYPSVFRRNEYGLYDISDKYFMPVVRNVPFFPAIALKENDTWKGQGVEAHDFKDIFGLEKPFTFPFNVDYEYVGTTEIENKTYHIIKASYIISYNVPKGLVNNYRGQNDVPLKIVGKSNQTLYWDQEKGNLFTYNENFHIRIILKSGNFYDFIGKSNAHIIESKPDTDAASYIKTELEKLNLEDTNIKNTEEGLTISIENIQFLPNSSILMESEKEKLSKIAQILSKLPNKEFLISGHTALAGTEKERLELSEKRASAVANYLIELGVQKRERIYTRGFGALKPITQVSESQAKNRRVEITILE